MRPECRSQMVPTSCGCCETSTLLQFSPLCQVPDRRTPPRALFRLQQAQLNLHRELAAFPAHSAELQGCSHGRPLRDRKSTRLNSSHVRISYAVFCLKKKKPTTTRTHSKLSKTAPPTS